MIVKNNFDHVEIVENRKGPCNRLVGQYSAP